MNETTIRIGEETAKLLEIISSQGYGKSLASLSKDENSDRSIYEILAVNGDLDKYFDYKNYFTGIKVVWINESNFNRLRECNHDEENWSDTGRKLLYLNFKWFREILKKKPWTPNKSGEILDDDTKQFWEQIKDIGDLHE